MDMNEKSAINAIMAPHTDFLSHADRQTLFNDAIKLVEEMGSAEGITGARLVTQEGRNYRPALMLVTSPEGELPQRSITVPLEMRPGFGLDNLFDLDEHGAIAASDMVIGVVRKPQVFPVEGFLPEDHQADIEQKLRDIATPMLEAAKATLRDRVFAGVEKQIDDYGISDEVDPINVIAMCQHLGDYLWDIEGVSAVSIGNLVDDEARLALVMDFARERGQNDVKGYIPLDIDSHDLGFSGCNLDDIVTVIRSSSSEEVELRPYEFLLEDRAADLEQALSDTIDYQPGLEHFDEIAQAHETRAAHKRELMKVQEQESRGLSRATIPKEVEKPSNVVSLSSRR